MKTFRARAETRYTLGLFFVLAVVAAWLCAASGTRTVGEALFLVILMLHLSCRGILAEASGGVGSVYLVLVTLCPFLHPFLVQLQEGEMVGLAVSLAGVIGVQWIALSALKITVDDAGVSCKRFLRAPVVIAWQDVETVKCRVVNRMDSSGIAVSTNAKIFIAAGKRRVAFSSLQCKIPPGEVKSILEKAAPSAIEWTLNALRDAGEVSLGPVYLCKKGFKFRGRLYCNMQMGQDSIRLEEGSKKVNFTYDRLLNGQYLMEILDRAKLRA